jgi:hypothetical protein
LAKAAWDVGLSLVTLVVSAAPTEECMKSFNRRCVNNCIAAFLAVTIPACSRDAVTEPTSTEPTSPAANLRLEAISATELEGTVGERVSPVPAVIVRSENGQPAAGIRVTFTPLRWFYWTYDDSVTQRVVTTDSRGVATPRDWTLGTEAGVHGLEASILDAHIHDANSGAGHTVVFQAAAKAGVPAALQPVFLRDTVGLPGDVFDSPMVKVIDRYGNGTSGVSVIFSVSGGGGSLEKNSDEATGGSGSAGTWTLGPKPGLNSVVASAPGVSSATFNVRALDAGVVTWYDLVPQSVRLIVSGSIALCENGTFELVTVETSDALPGQWRDRRFGTYTISGTGITLIYSAPWDTERAALAGDSLTLVQHAKPNWHNTPAQEWTFVKRK